MLKGKIHRATVTEANLDYMGSLTLDQDLMDAVGLKEYEKIQILDITNGSRLETYIIKGERGSGQVCINGAAAHLIHAGDIVIIVSYCQLSNEEALIHQPTIVYVDSDNRILSTSTERLSLI
tara:strand:+ start:426 stop:791 length:366 start_codon:yes stop_codon:yes gene_type:complete